MKRVARASVQAAQEAQTAKAKSPELESTQTTTTVHANPKQKTKKKKSFDWTCQDCPHKKFTSNHDKEAHLQGKYHLKRVASASVQTEQPKHTSKLPESKSQQSDDCKAVASASKQSEPSEQHSKQQTRITQSKAAVSTSSKRQSDPRISNQQIAKCRSIGEQEIQPDGSVHYRLNGICVQGNIAFLENELEWENAALHPKMHIRLGPEEFRAMMMRRIERPFKDTYRMVADLKVKLDKQEKAKGTHIIQLNPMSFKFLTELQDRVKFNKMCVHEGLKPLYDNEQLKRK